MGESEWIYYEQFAVVASLFAAFATAWIAWKRSRVSWKKSFIVSLTWDFSRSWATNVSSLAGIIGVTIVTAVTTDFKPFTGTVKSSFVVTSLLMGAIVVAAPSIYTLLQKERDDQMVGSVGGFVTASMFTIWGTVAQILLQAALLFMFIAESFRSRAALVLVPTTLLLGLLILFPYAVRSIGAALLLETKAPALPPGALDHLKLEVTRPEADETKPPAAVIVPVPRKVAIL
jgi:hypothetical protein